jgi:hypothetical protein
MFCDEIGWKNGGDFWISGLASPGPKVQKSLSLSRKRRMFAAQREASLRDEYGAITK